MFAPFGMFRSRRGTIQTGCGVNFLIDIVNNVVFVSIACLVYLCNSESSLTENRCTWYETHYHNNLRLSVLDEDLSQAQLAPLDEFLNFGVF